MKDALWAEGRRKLVHVGSGLFCTSLPWLFSEAWQVDLLAVIAVAVLLLLRRLSLGPLYGVQRLSFGEILFPVGVAILFRLSADQLGVYLAALGTLTFADTAGALVGQRYGRHRYRTTAGRKSVEGSLAVFGVSFLITLICFREGDWMKTFLIAGMVGVVAAMVEGILGAGMDNLILPLSVFGLFHFLADLNRVELLMRVGVIGGLIVLLILVRRLTSLNGGGMLSAVVFGYLCFGLGGGGYLIGPILLFAVHLFTVWRKPELRRFDHSASFVASIALPGLVWVSLGYGGTFDGGVCELGFSLVMAAQVALLHAASQSFLKEGPRSLVCLGKVGLVGLACWHPFLLILPVISRFGEEMNLFARAGGCFGFSLLALTIR